MNMAWSCCCTATSSSSCRPAIFCRCAAGSKPGCTKIAKLGEMKVPVYLLHGAHDNVIPPSETDAAGLELGAARHIALVSPLIEHVEVSKSAGFGDQLALVSFMAQLL